MIDVHESRGVPEMHRGRLGANNEGGLGSPSFSFRAVLFQLSEHAFDGLLKWREVLVYKKILCHTSRLEDRHLLLEDALAEARFDGTVLDEIDLTANLILELVFQMNEVKETRLVRKINEDVHVARVGRFPACDRTEDRRAADASGFEDGEDLDLDCAEVIRHISCSIPQFLLRWKLDYARRIPDAVRPEGGGRYL